MTAIVKIKVLDVAALERLRDESALEGFRFVERLREEWISGENRFQAPGEALFLAIDGDHAIGVCGLNRDPYARDARIGRVRRLFVLQAHRNQGVGRALVDAVIAHARTHFESLRVRTDAANDFFIARGFRQVEPSTQTTHVLDLSNIPLHVADPSA
jgi:GNAT superfamily N-acetyltransferase